MKLSFSVAGQLHLIRAERAPDGATVELDGETAHVHSVAYDPPRLTFVHGDKLYTARIVREGHRRWIHIAGVTTILERGELSATRASSLQRAGTGAGLVTAPMPGQVRAVLINVGDWVQAGQPLMLLEAMKLEIRVTAAGAGQVARLNVRPGDSVEREQILAEVRAESEVEPL